MKFWTGRFQKIVTSRHRDDKQTQVLCQRCGKWTPVIGAVADRDHPFTYYHEGCVPEVQT